MFVTDMGQILIVDDNVQNLYLARFLLEQQGYSIMEAHNGQEAVNMARELNFKLILMDIQMPVMNGLDSARLIKQNMSSAVIVALTAKAMSGDREAILASGCDGYIEKPINPQKFVSQVECFFE